MEIQANIRKITFYKPAPSYINLRGQHGLTLLRHAQKGGDGAKELLDLIKTKGLTQTKINLY